MDISSDSISTYTFVLDNGRTLSSSKYYWISIKETSGNAVEVETSGADDGNYSGSLNTTGPLVKKPSAKLIVKKYKFLISPVLRYLTKE